MASLIEEGLDQVVDFSIENKTLPEAFMVIADESGIPIRVDGDVLKLLPYGPDTRIKDARMHNVPLRTGLTRLLKPLALSFRVAGEHLQVEPRASLLRIGRRATWTELETLEWLSGLSWEHSAEQMAELRGRLQIRVDGDDAAETLFGSMRDAGRGTAEEVLTIACQANGWSWFAWGSDVVVLPTGEQVYRELQRRVTIKAQHKPLTEVLMEVSNQARLPFSFAPGAIGSVPAETQRDFSLLLIDTPAQQGLEVISGVTGLGFRPKDGGIEIFHTQPAVVQTADKAPADANAIIGRVIVPSADGSFQYEFLIRESDLPPDLRDVRKERIAEVIETLRQEAKAVKDEQ